MKINHDLLVLSIKQAFNKAELRARVSKGLLKDQIHLAVFEKTIHDYLDKKELKLSLELGLLIKEQIKESNGQYKTIYIYTGKECKQVTGFKKFVNKLKFWS